jgi:SulP family sulfate permease
MSKSSLNPGSEEPDAVFSWRRLRGKGSTGTPASALEAFPLGRVLRHYTRKDAKADAKAGFNVALLDFPQGMAYALIAGLPFAMGIYASAVAAFLGPLLASSRFVMLGPTNAIAVMTLSAFLGLQMSGEEVVVALPLLLLMVSVLMLLGGLLRVANMINYVSRTVVTGYITAAAFLIVIKQLKNVLGLELPRTATFFDTLVETLRHIGATQMPAVVVGCSTVVVYLVLRRWLKALPDVAGTLVLMYFVSRGLEQWLGWEIAPLSAVPMPAGVWPLSMPRFSFELFAQLAQPALAIAFLSLLESASIAKTLAAKSGDTVNINQQMLSMGVANAGCAFLSGMPISGSLTRSSLNQSSGARTPVASMFGALLLALGVLFLAPYMADIPMPALSGLVIMVGLSLINRRNIRIVLGTTRSDAVVFMVTFGAGLLLPLDTAIYFGVVVSVLLFMRKAGTPQMAEYAFSETGKEFPVESERPALALLHVEGDLFFGSSDIFLEQARKVTADPALKVIILRLRNAHNLDATCAMAMEQLVRFAREKGRHVLVCGAHPEVVELFRNSGLLQTIGSENVFCEDPENPTRSNSEALKRARDLVGTHLDVRLFVSERKG